MFMVLSDFCAHLCQELAFGRFSGLAGAVTAVFAFQLADMVLTRTVSLAALGSRSFFLSIFQCIIVVGGTGLEPVTPAM